MVNELYRQGVHLVVGVVLAILTLLLPKGAFLVLSGLLVLAYCVVVFLFRKEVRWLFILLERESAAFAGKGGLFFFLGIFFVAALFWEHATLAILLLAVSDSLATMIAILYASPKLPYNHRKSIIGSAAFFISACLVLSFTVRSGAVFLIAFFLTALESFDYREIPFLDDNLVIPVVAGYMLSLL